MKKDSGTRIVSIFSAILCLSCVVAIICLNKNGICYETTNLLVAILGVITAVLIGFQLYNILNLDNRLDNVRREIEIKADETEIHLKNEFSQFKSAADRAIGRALELAKCEASAMSLVEMSTVHARQRDYGKSVILCLEALILCKGKGVSSFGKAALDTAIDHLKEIEELRQRGNDKPIIVTREEKDRYRTLVDCLNPHDWGIISSLIDGLSVK